MAEAEAAVRAEAEPARRVVAAPSRRATWTFRGDRRRGSEPDRPRRSDARGRKRRWDVLARLSTPPRLGEWTIPRRRVTGAFLRYAGGADLSVVARHPHRVTCVSEASSAAVATGDATGCLRVIALSVDALGGVADKADPLGVEVRARDDNRPATAEHLLVSGVAEAAGAHAGAVTGVHLVRDPVDARVVVSGGADRVARVWAFGKSGAGPFSLAIAREVRCGGGLTPCCFAPLRGAETMLAVGTAEGVLAVWAVRRAGRERRLRVARSFGRDRGDAAGRDVDIPRSSGRIAATPRRRRGAQRCLRDASRGLRGADRGDAAGRDADIPRPDEGHTDDREEELVPKQNGTARSGRGPEDPVDM